MNNTLVLITGSTFTCTCGVSPQKCQFTCPVGSVCDCEFCSCALPQVIESVRKQIESGKTFHLDKANLISVLFYNLVKTNNIFQIGVAFHFRKCLFTRRLSSHLTSYAQLKSNTSKLSCVSFPINFEFAF